MDRTSLLYWYPKIKDLVPTPKTEWVEASDGECIEWLDNPIPEEKLKEIYEKAREIGYPLFMRTSHFSAKHDYNYTCYVESGRELLGHLRGLLDMSFAKGVVGLPIDAIVFREYLELDWRFKAFEGLPIATEVRRFIKDGENLCWHFYWPEQSMRFIGNEGERVKNRDWRQHLKDMRATAMKEREIHEEFAERVANKLDGYWSVDFARTSDGEWFLIDMGAGELSYHPRHMPKTNARRERRERGG